MAVIAAGGGPVRPECAYLDLPVLIGCAFASRRALSRYCCRKSMMDRVSSRVGWLLACLRWWARLHPRSQQRITCNMSAFGHPRLTNFTEPRDVQRESAVTAPALLDSVLFDNTLEDLTACVLMSIFDLKGSGDTSWCLCDRQLDGKSEFTAVSRVLFGSLTS